MQARTHVVALLALGLAALSITSCSGRTGGAPIATSSSSGAASTSAMPSATSAGSGVPTVGAPLDPAPYLGQPCKLIPDSVLKSMGYVKPGKPDTDSKTATKVLGPSCAWHEADSSFTITIDTVAQRIGRGGLAAVYKANESGWFEYFAPVQIPGHAAYPAVEAEEEDERAEGKCSLYVGIRDDLTFIVHNYHDAEPEGSCTAAQKLAAEVIGTLKGGS